MTASELREQVADFHTVDEATQVSPVIAMVFATAELLEAILLYVDLKTVLLSQRVSMFWQAVINGSPKLQRALFAPSINDDFYTLEDRQVYTYYNPVKDTTADSFLAGNVEAEYDPEATGWSELHWLTADLLVNPFMQSIFRRERWYTNHEIAFFDKYAGGSWEAMLLVKPPVRTVYMKSKLCTKVPYTNWRGLKYDSPSGEWDIEEHSYITNETGITLGDVATMLEMVLDTAKEEYEVRDNSTSELFFEIITDNREL